MPLVKRKKASRTEGDRTDVDTSGILRFRYFIAGRNRRGDCIVGTHALTDRHVHVLVTAIRDLRPEVAHVEVDPYDYYTALPHNLVLVKLRRRGVLIYRLPLGTAKLAAKISEWWQRQSHHNTAEVVCRTPEDLL